MRHVPFALALLLLGGLALAFVLGRPAPPDDSLFGPQMALPPALAPLAAPRGELVLRGRVVHAGGEPAGDVLVTLVRDADDAAETEPLYHAYTGADGRFEFARLAPGAYDAVLVHRDVPPLEIAVELPLAGGAPASDAPASDPSTGTVLWELPPPLPPLEVLPELGRGSVAGRIALPPALGESVPDLAGFEVVLVPAEGTPPLAGAAMRRAATDAEGRFALDGVVAAAYRVEVLPPWARGGSWPVLARSAATIADGASAELEIPLEVGALAGELAEARGGPLTGALVAVSALEARDAVGAPQLWPPATSDDAGAFRVGLLPAGRYRVHLRAGAASSDVEVEIEAGAVARMAEIRLDVRSGGVLPGG